MTCNIWPQTVDGDRMKKNIDEEISTQNHTFRMIWWLSHLPFFAICTKYVSQFFKNYFFRTFHIQISIRFSLFRFSNYPRTNWIKLRNIIKKKEFVHYFASKWNNEWRLSRLHLASKIWNTLGEKAVGVDLIWVEFLFNNFFFIKIIFSPKFF